MSYAISIRREIVARKTTFLTTKKGLMRKEKGLFFGLSLFSCVQTVNLRVWG